MTVDNYSTNDSNNTDQSPNGAPDGMIPSDVIDVFRRIMSDQRTQLNQAQWFRYLDGEKDNSPADKEEYVSANVFKINGNDATAHYHVGRRVKVVGATTVVSNITNVAYSSGATQVTVEDAIPSGTIAVYTSILTHTDHAMPEKAIKDIVGEMVADNTESNITVTYETSDGTLDFSSSSGSDENFTTALLNKLNGIAESANNYVHPTSSGNKHIPAGGASGEYLAWDSADTAAWATAPWVPNTGNSNIDGIKSFTANTNSTNKDTGAVVITGGGLGIEGNMYAGGQVGGSNTSDRRLKMDVKPIQKPLAKVKMLSGNSFFYKDPESDEQKGLQYGLIAQEVNMIMPEIIQEKKDKTLAIKTGGHELIGLLVAAINELSARVDELEGK